MKRLTDKTRISGKLSAKCCVKAYHNWSGGVTERPMVTVLKAWADPNLAALIKAIEAKDKAEFEKAYDTAIVGCNGCHAGSEGGPLKSMAAFKIVRPTTPLLSNIDYKGP
ncbi:MAG: hypothetical protein HY530_03105 [Chloroflexi bacterium]|nr:hypothetical protein [Chloroflexota bacterium]